ncbi:MAG: glycosyltransferase family 4 protein [bacterium]|nr:MAG: glycosyltransferase family 4 protein [bacterium]
MTERKRRILILSIWEDFWSLGKGSGVPDELHFSRYLTDRGFELHYLIPEPARSTGPTDGARLNFHTYPNIFRSLGRIREPLLRFLRPPAFNRAVLDRLRGLAASLQPDLLLGLSHYSLKPLHIVGSELGLPTAVKLFGVMYLGRFELPRLTYWMRNFDQVRALRHTVDHYIVLNDGTQGKLALTRLGIPPEKISFLQNGMNLAWADTPVDRPLVRSRLGLPREDICVATLARLVKSKRVELFLRVAARLDAEARSRSSFVIGGDGPERDALALEARRLGLDDRVIFTGVIPHDEVVQFLKVCDIFVGTNELTNMSMPPCEAILCGVPVVAFDVSGTAEVVRDGETGLLATDGDIEGLARALGSLIMDEPRRKRLGRQAAEFGRRHFVSWNERIGMELSLIERLIGAGPERS